MSDFANLELERPLDGVLIARLNRPDRLNALDFALLDELRGLRRRVEADDEVRALILTGSGRGFCAGLDLYDLGRLGGMTAPEMLRRQEGWADAVTGFRLLPKPVIAAVNGAAAGAGMALALAADIRVVSEAAKFNAAFIRVGLSGGDVGVSWMLPRIVGLGHAAEIMMTGGFVDAAKAERIGLANRVVAAADLIDSAVGIAAEIVANSPFGISLTKQVLQTNVDAPSLAAALELENRNQVLATRGEDMQEALAAFLERRDPSFKEHEPTFLHTRRDR